MARFSLLTLSLLATFASWVQAGSSVYYIYMQSPPKTYIATYSISITVPSVPSSNKNSVGTVVVLEGPSSLMEASLFSYSTTNSNPCGATAGQWCIQCLQIADGVVSNGTTSLVKSGDVLMYNVARDTTGNGGYLLQVTRSGKVISQVTAKSSSAVNDLLISTTCKGTGTIPNFTYTGSKTGLALAYPNYAKESDQGGSNTNSGLHTSDGGMTWILDTLTLPSAPCNG